MDLAYFAADTLNVTLYQINSQLQAKEVHEATLGPWRMDLPVDVTSDIMSGTELGFWVTLGRTLHLYVVIRERENWLFVFNKVALRACGRNTGFAADTVKGRIKEFKPAIKAVFGWKNDEWVRVEYDGAHGRGNAHDLVQSHTPQGADEPVPGASHRAGHSGERRK